MYTADHGAALLASFTEQQRRAIYQLVHSSADPEGRVREIIAEAGALVPLFRLVDIGPSVSPTALVNWQTGMVSMFISALTKAWTKEEVARMIEQGAAIPSDYAMQIAERVVSPDTDLAGFAYRILDAIAAVPFVPDFIKGASGPMFSALNFLHSTLSNPDRARDNSATMLRLGEALNKLAMETQFTLAEAAFEARLAPPDERGFMQALGEIWEWLTNNSPNFQGPARLPAPDSGDLPALAETFAELEEGDPAAAEEYENNFHQFQEVASDLLREFEEGDPSAAWEAGFIPPSVAAGAASGLVSGIAKLRARRKKRRRATQAPVPVSTAKKDLAAFRRAMEEAGLDPSKKSDVRIAVHRIAYAG